MPFKVQCPYPECAKFMLVEDSDRGKSVDCLICKRTIRLTGAGAEPPSVQTSRREAPPPQPAARPAAPRPAPTGQAPPMPPPPQQPMRPQSPAARPAQPPAKAPAAEFAVRQCPQCQSHMRVPAAAAGQAVRCPKCSHIFS